MITYRKWEDVPEGLMTKTQLKAEGLKPAPEQKPAARISGRHDVYALYDKSDAVPVRVLSEAQKAAALVNIEKARDALTCVDCGLRARRGRTLVDGRCRHCRKAHRDRAWAKNRLKELVGRNDWLVLDTETTGFARSDEVISLAVVSAEGEVLFNELIRPTIPIPESATYVNGITDEMVMNAAAFTDVYPQIASLLTGRLVLAYNAGFDCRMLQQDCERYNLPVIEAEWECAMELYAAAKGRLRRDGDFALSRLEEACRQEGIGGILFHEACADAQATRLLVLAVGKEIRDAIQSAGNTDRYSSG